MKPQGSLHAQHKPRLRGQAEVIGALLAAVAVIIIVIYLMNFVLPTVQEQRVQQTLRDVFERERALENLNTIFYKNTSKLCIENRGGVVTTIVRIWYQTPAGTLAFKNTSLTLHSGQELCIPFTEGKPTYIVTARGNVFKVTMPQEIVVAAAERAAAAEAVIVTPLSTIFAEITDLEDLLRSNEVYIAPQLLTQPTPENIAEGDAYGMQRNPATGQLVLKASYRNARILIVSKDFYYNYVEPLISGSQPEVPENVKPYAAVGNIFIGLTPVGEVVNCNEPGTRKYNILITGPGTGSYYSNFYDPTPVVVIRTSEGWQEPLILDKPYRIRIIGLRLDNITFMYGYMDYTVKRWWQIVPVWRSFITIANEPSLCEEGLGYWWLYGSAVIDVDDDRVAEYVDIYVFINGTADLVEVYTSDNTVMESNYRPYMLVLDTDRNGVGEVLFTTEDANFGPGGICGEDDQSMGFDLRDLSGDITNTTCTYALPLVETYGAYAVVKCPALFYFIGENFRVNGEKYVMVSLAVRLYYHDSEGGDVDCVETPNAFMIGFFLVDPGQDGRPATRDDIIVSANMFMYQQLDDWEDTWPPNKNSVTLMVPLLVPEEDKEFYIAVGFMDPYGFDGGVDDLDFTAAVELIGLTFYLRGG